MAFTPIKTHKIVTTGTHSTIAIDTSELLTRGINSGRWQVRITTITVSAAMLMGTDSTVEASVAVASAKLTGQNTHMLAGTVELFDLPTGITHISAEGFAAGPGEMWITVGFGEKI